MVQRKRVGWGVASNWQPVARFKKWPTGCGGGDPGPPALNETAVFTCLGRAHKMDAGRPLDSAAGLQQTLHCTLFCSVRPRTLTDSHIHILPLCITLLYSEGVFCPDASGD